MKTIKLLSGLSKQNKHKYDSTEFWGDFIRYARIYHSHFNLNIRFDWNSNETRATFQYFIIHMLINLWTYTTVVCILFLLNTTTSESNLSFITNVVVFFCCLFEAQNGTIHSCLSNGFKLRYHNTNSFLENLTFSSVVW